jgi:DNA primase
MDKAEIESLKAANPILDVLGDLGIDVQNNRIRCLQPQNHAHGDRTPSVTIWPEKGSFKCWVCPEVKGDVIDLIRLSRGCTFREALEFLAKNGLGTAPLPPKQSSTGNPAPNPRHYQPDRLPSSSSHFPKANIETDLVDPVLALDQPATAQSKLQFNDLRSEAPKPELDPEHTATHSLVSPRQGKSLNEDNVDTLRLKILVALLKACTPVSGKVGQYLVKRRIFKPTWDKQKLRMIDDYAGISQKLETEFGHADLERTGFFNTAGHLRYYRHKLLFPYLNAQGKAVYMQARAIDADAKPKELSMSGPIPIPYNCRILDGEPGQIYLCEGVIDTLTLIEQGFPAVGVPGAANFKSAWAEMFRNKTVHVAFDPDAPGESGAIKTMEILHAHGIEARRFAPPKGMDLNDWFQKG